MSDPADWVADHVDGAPAELQERVLAWIHGSGADGGGEPERLVAAGRLALAAAVSGGGGRAVALDLLAADALVTLALQAQAELAPERLEAFARRVRQDGAAQA